MVKNIEWVRFNAHKKCGPRSQIKQGMEEVKSGPFSEVAVFMGWIINGSIFFMELDWFSLERFKTGDYFPKGPMLYCITSFSDAFCCPF